MNGRLKRRLNVRRIVAALTLLSATSLVAQTDDSEILVEPERVQGSVAPVSVVVGQLPPLPELPLAPLPFERTVSVETLPQDELELPAIPRDTLSAVAVATRDEQIFFNATLGGGSVNSVLGAINVFRLGDGPQFRLGYDHQSSDGFGFNDLGGGFSSSVNTIDTWIRLGGASREVGAGAQSGASGEVGAPGESSASREVGAGPTLELEALYRDSRDGLQGQPAWYAAERRTLAARVRAEVQSGTRATAYLDLAVDDEQRVLSAIDPAERSPLEAYRSLRPAVGGVIEWPRFRVAGEGWYDGRFLAGSGPDDRELRPSSRVGADVSLEGVPYTGVTLRGSAGARYRLGDTASFPAQVGLSIASSERWALDLDGGYRVDETSVTDVWDAYLVPAVVGSEDLDAPELRELFLDGALSVALIPQLVELDAAVNWGEREGVLGVGAYDDNQGVFPLQVESRSIFDSEVSLAFQVGQRLRVQSGLLSRWADRDFGATAQNLSASARGEWRRAAADIDVIVPLDTERAIPELGFTVDYAVAEDVDVQVFGTDLLAPLDTAGRTRQGGLPDATNPFITPGFEVGLSVRVSF